jgi:hypothetical protein
VRDALDILLRRGRMVPEDDMTVVVLAGDGSTFGMGLAATSAAIERRLDFLYRCYDSEGYGNTGQQTSDATPHGARTATDVGASGYGGWNKDLFAIWAAHRPAYVATVVGAEPLDLAKKIERALALKGPALDPRAGSLPDRLGLRSPGHGRDRSACRPDRPLPPEGIRRRHRRPHEGAAPEDSGRGLPRSPGPLRASLRADAKRARPGADSGRRRCVLGPVRPVDALKGYESAMTSLSSIADAARRVVGKVSETRRRSRGGALRELCGAHWAELRGKERKAVPGIHLTRLLAELGHA